MLIRKVHFGDWADWIALAKEMEGLFQGEMAENPKFHRVMRRIISREEAITAVDEAGRCVGIIAVSRRKNAISWFAVSEEDRGRGIGSILLAAGIDLLNRREAISVITFREEYEGGTPARRLYRKFGFRDAEEVLHHGQPRSLMIRKPMIHAGFKK